MDRSTSWRWNAHAAIVAAFCAQWYRVSNFEGASGYYVVAIAIFGGIAGIVIAFMGVAFSLIPAVMWPSVAYLVPEGRLGTAYSVMTLVQQVGLAGMNWVIGAANDAIMKLRSGAMGTLVATGLDAPGRLADVLKANGHVAMLVDQYYVRGVDITFFGRKTRANPFLARLARHIDCPIHGARIVRLPGDKFRIDVTEEIPAVRDTNGEIDVDKTTQAINDVIEGWVREHPAQWLWVHRKWRND